MFDIGWRRSFSVLGLALFSVFQLTAIAASAATTEALLQRQLDLIAKIRTHLEPEALPRLLVLQRATEKAAAALRTSNAGGGRVFKAHVNLVIRYRRSNTLFEEYSSPVIESELRELRETVEEIAKIMDIDDSLYLKITAETFDQIHELILQFSRLSPDGPLYRKLMDLNPEIGQLVAIGRLDGDKLSTYEKAIPLCRELLEVGEELLKLTPGSPAEKLGLEIHGLLLWYIDFSGIGAKLHPEG